MNINWCHSLSEFQHLQLFLKICTKAANTTVIILYSTIDIREINIMVNWIIDLYCDKMCISG